MKLNNKWNKINPDNKFEDFPIGTKVKIISDMVDFHFFNNDSGIVIKNNNRYLGIIVKFDRPRRFKGGYIQEDFNFNPENLEVIKYESDT